MRWKSKTFILILILYGSISLYLSFLVFGHLHQKSLYKPSLLDIFANGDKVDRQILDPGFYRRPKTIELWGDQDVALYLWNDILGAQNERFHKVEDIVFRFRPIESTENSRPSIFVDAVVVVSSGRSPASVERTKQLLDQLVVQMGSTANASILNVPVWTKKRNIGLGLFLIGDELCHNPWLPSYIRSHGGLLDFVFITYNAIEMEEIRSNIHRWPLGIAAYRYFPPISSINYAVRSRRKHFCNFYGTVHRGSSRVQLVEELLALKRSNRTNVHCEVYARYEWTPEEPEWSSARYQETVIESDFTLCPVGLNEETYRIYEALSMGSIPIIEDTPPAFLAEEHKSRENLCHRNSSTHLQKSVASNYAEMLFKRKLLERVDDTQSRREKSRRRERRNYADFLKKEGSFYYESQTGRVVVAEREEDDVLATVGDVYDVPRRTTRTHDMLKRYAAPVLFSERIGADLVTNLRRGLSQKDVVAWRKMAVAWYDDFRRKMREKFVDVVRGSFTAV